MMCRRDGLCYLHVINVILYQYTTSGYAHADDFEKVKGAILVKLEIQQIRFMFALERKNL